MDPAPDAAGAFWNLHESHTTQLLCVLRIRTVPVYTQPMDSTDTTYTLRVGRSTSDSIFLGVTSLDLRPDGALHVTSLDGRAYFAPGKFDYFVAVEHEPTIEPTIVDAAQPEGAPEEGRRILFEVLTTDPHYPVELAVQEILMSTSRATTAIAFDATDKEPAEWDRLELLYWDATDDWDGTA